MLWGRHEVLERLRPDKLRPSADHPAARRFETGTQSFEGQAGTTGAVDYLACLGALVEPDAQGRREQLCAATRAARRYEDALGERLLAGLRAIDGVRLWGAPTMDGRVPTFGLTIAGHDPRRVSQALGDQGIFAWAGHFYAVEAVARLGLADEGGLLRLGLCHYNTVDEVDRTLDALEHIVRGPARYARPADTKTARSTRSSAPS